MAFKIESTIPIPPLYGSGNGKYPFAELEVGQSFFVPDLRKRVSLSTYPTKFKPKKFTVRLVTEDGVAGIRVWRIE